MSVNYQTVLDELLAERAQLDAAIAALEPLAGRVPVAVPPAERAIRPRRALARAKVTAPRPAARSAEAPAPAPPTDRASIIRGIVIAEGDNGLKLSEIAASYAKRAKDDRVAPSALSKFLSAMVEQGQLARFGVKSAARYWPAGTTAKEAV